MTYTRRRAQHTCGGNGGQHQKRAVQPHHTWPHVVAHRIDSGGKSFVGAPHGAAVPRPVRRRRDDLPRVVARGVAAVAVRRGGPGVPRVQPQPRECDPERRVRRDRGRVGPEERGALHDEDPDGLCRASAVASAADGVVAQCQRGQGCAQGAEREGIGTAGLGYRIRAQASAPGEQVVGVPIRHDGPLLQLQVTGLQGHTGGGGAEPTRDGRAIRAVPSAIARDEGWHLQRT